MESWIYTLLTLAIVLVFIEIFLVPGVGIVGVLGFIALIAATYLATQRYGAAIGFSMFAGSLFVMVIAFVLFFRSPASKWLVLKSNLATGDSLHKDIAQGLEGITATSLRPTGKAVFKISGTDKQFDVVTAGEFIDEQKIVQVLRVEGSRIVVREKAVG